MRSTTVRTSLALLACAPLLVLAACSGQSDSAVGTWGDESPGEPQLVLEENGRLTGTDGCNRLNGSWKQDGQSIAFSEVASTMMACPDVDTWLLGLSTAELSGDELLISDAAGDEIGSLARNGE